MLFANSDTFKSSLPIWVSLLSFSFCLISLARTITATLKRNGKNGYPCLVSGILVLFLNLARSPSFSSLWYWLWVCHKWPLLCWDMFPLYQLLKVISFFLFFIFFNFIFKLYIIVLVLPNIKMNPPQVYMCSPSWTLLPPPSPFFTYGFTGSSLLCVGFLKLWWAGAPL